MTFTQFYRLVDVQAQMQLKADASRFSLGFLWWFLEPLMWVFVFFVVFNLILHSDRRSGDFLLFLACGKFAYIWFSKSVVQASTSIVRSEGLIGKVNVPKAMFPLASVHEGMYRQASIYLLLFAVLAISGIGPSLHWLWMLPIAVVMYLMICACSLAAAFVVCMLRDFQKIVPLFMTFLLFTSGIFWDVHDIGSKEKTQLLLNLNPMAFILDAHRQVLMYHHNPDIGHLAWIGLGALACTAGMLLLMHKKSRYLALKVLT